MALMKRLPTLETTRLNFGPHQAGGRKLLQIDLGLGLGGGA